jgi:hypothetical protein
MAKPHLAAFALVALLVAQARGQTAGGMAVPESAAEDPNRWSFALAVYGYLVPDEQSYFSPTFSADRKRLHLEARYNYENLRTGSLWAGYNLSVGDVVVVEVTPLLGAVFGDMNGVAPGYEMSLTYKRLEISSQGEYVIDATGREGNFFYSWNELVYSPTEWLHAGLIAQRTRAYQTPVDVQRGVSVGFAYRKIDFTTYVLNIGWADPTVVLALGVKF